MYNVSKHERLRPLFRNCVVLRFICSVDDGDAVEVGAGGREGDLRRRKTVRSRDVWYGGCLYRRSSSGEMDDVAAGASSGLAPTPGAPPSIT